MDVTEAQVRPSDDIRSTLERIRHKLLDLTLRNKLLSRDARALAASEKARES